MTTQTRVKSVGYFSGIVNQTAHLSVPVQSRPRTDVAKH